MESAINILLIALPPLVFSFETEMFGLKMQSFSRILRITKCMALLKNFEMKMESDVEKKIFQLSIFMVLLIYISSCSFMVIENMHPENLPKPYTIHVTFYFTVVTLSTVGYGDFYPYTDEGRMFILFMILYAIVYRIPSQTTELLRLMGMKSVYERNVYKVNVEIPHVIITGHVTLSGMQNVTPELFHPDHGSTDRHAVILQTSDPNNFMEMFLHDPKQAYSIKYLKGNPMSQKDLERACA